MERLGRSAASAERPRRRRRSPGPSSPSSGARSSAIDELAGRRCGGTHHGVARRFCPVTMRQIWLVPTSYSAAKRVISTPQPRSARGSRPPAHQSASPRRAAPRAPAARDTGTRGSGRRWRPDPARLCSDRTRHPWRRRGDQGARRCARDIGARYECHLRSRHRVRVQARRWAYQPSPPW